MTGWTSTKATDGRRGNRNFEAKAQSPLHEAVTTTEDSWLQSIRASFVWEIWSVVHEMQGSWTEASCGKDCRQEVYHSR